MKTLFTALPFVLMATLAGAHDSAHMHHHVGEESWLPLLAGLCVILTAAITGWVRK